MSARTSSSLVPPHRHMARGACGEVGSPNPPRDNAPEPSRGIRLTFTTDAIVHGIGAGYGPQVTLHTIALELIASLAREPRSRSPERAAIRTAWELP